MDIQPQPMTGAMHVEMAVIPSFNQSIGISNEKAQINETLNQRA